jgi:hypothetical protein
MIILTAYFHKDRHHKKFVSIKLVHMMQPADRLHKNRSHKINLCKSCFNQDRIWWYNHCSFYQVSTYDPHTTRCCGWMCRFFLAEQYARGIYWQPRVIRIKKIYIKFISTKLNYRYMIHMISHTAAGYTHTELIYTKFIFIKFAHQGMIHNDATHYYWLYR